MTESSNQTLEDSKFQELMAINEKYAVPLLKKGRPNEPAHSKAVRNHSLNIAKERGLDPLVMGTISLWHDTGYAEQFKDETTADLATIRSKKADHMPASVLFAKQFLERPDVSPFYTEDQKSQILEIIGKHDLVGDLKSDLELAFMEADTLGAMENPTFNQDDMQKYVEVNLLQKRFPKFFTEYGKNTFYKLLINLQAAHNYDLGGLKIENGIIGKRVEIESDQNNLVGSLVLAQNYRFAPSVYICHGAAKEPLNPVKDLLSIQNYLANEGISSLVVNSRGVGSGEDKSGGSYFSTIGDRVVDNLQGWEFLKKYVDIEKMFLAGSSMGGQVASVMAPELAEKLKGIILIAPAAYAPDAENIPLGPDFSQFIRANKSEEISKSPAFDSLRTVSSIPLLVVIGAEDQVIVESAKQGYKSAVQDRGDSGAFVELSGIAHNSPATPDNRLHEQIINFIKKFA